MQHTTDVVVSPFIRLSGDVRAAWAKSDVDHATGELLGWLPLYQHLADTAAVAAFVWDDWLPPSIKDYIAADAGSAVTARELAVWLAAQHDIGKLSPAFAVQVPALARQMTVSGLPISSGIAGTEERRLARHEAVSYLAIADWLAATNDVRPTTARQLASVLAAHHGLPPDAAAVNWVRVRPHLAGDGSWHHARVELIEAMTGATRVDVAGWRDLDLSQPTLALLSAIVIVSDWIASSDHFPLASPGSHPLETASERAERAWRRLEMPTPWTAKPPPENALLFRSRFSLPEGSSPRPVQEELMRLAREVPEPCLMILEAEMGVGKTEAALAAAEILAARFNRSGVFIGLPTQATADGMFGRVLEWARRLGLETPSSVYLAHGKSGLNETFAALAQDARFRALRVGDPARVRDAFDELVAAHHWMSSTKRGPLADFVIGTIDQALFGGLGSRHVMLRHLALAGKVVVLDEVHAYDAYTGQFLERVLHWLGAYRVPVVLLSATLPAERRRAFVDAYDSGRRPRPTALPKRSRTWQPARTVPDPHENLLGDIGYPSIVTSRSGEAPDVSTPGGTGRETSIRLERLPDDTTALRDLLGDALAEGGCAVVIRNTVRRVQETAAALRADFGDDVIVAHSRFLGLDRARKDRLLLELFGRDGRRPRRSIVVASQVVEQSLDIDFDIMVSDTAPIDLLLQRAGRLHRHERAHRPSRVREPRLILTGTEWTTTPPRTNRDSRAVYGEHLLLRTLAVLENRQTLTLPSDIPSLVQTVYGEKGIGPASWHDDMASAAQAWQKRVVEKRSEADVFRLREPSREPGATLLGWIRGATADPAEGRRAQATVRDTEETLEVLVVQRDAVGILRTPAWIPEVGGLQIPDNDLPDHALTNVILGCALRLPAALCRPRELDRHIRTLEQRYPVAAWHGSHALRGELVLELDQHGRATLDRYALTYSRDDGLSFVTLESIPESEVPL